MECKKQKKWFVFLAFLMLLFMAGCKEEKREYENAGTTVPEVTDFDGVTAYILALDVYKYDKDFMEALAEESYRKIIEEKIKDAQNSHEEAKLDFIYATIYGYLGDIDTAIQYYQNSLETGEKEDSILAIRCYYELSRLYIYEEEYTLSEEMMEEAEEIDTKDTETKNYLINMYILRAYDISDTPNGAAKAIAIMEKAKEQAEESGYSDMEKLYFNLAQAYSYGGKYILASNYDIKALEFATEEDDEESLYVAQREVGINYSNAGNYESALVYLENAYELALKFEDEEELAYICDFLSFVKLQTKDYKGAYEALEKEKECLYALPESNEVKDNITNYYSSIAEYYAVVGDTQKARENIKIAEERYNEETMFLISNFDINFDLVYGKIYYKEGQYEKSLEKLLQAQAKYEKNGLGSLAIEELEIIYDSYKKTGDAHNALVYAEKMRDMLTQRLDSAEEQQADYVMQEYDRSQKVKQIEVLRDKNKYLWMTTLLGTALVMIMVVFVIINVINIRKIRSLNKKLRTISEIDELTKLYNRRALDAWLEGNWKQLKQAQEQIFIAMMDVDYFKKYNDYYGHQAGDDVLETVGDCIRNAISKTDFPVRYGGEEFMIIMPYKSEQEVLQTLKNIRQFLYQKQILHEKSEVDAYVTLSIGYAQAQEQNGYMEVIHQADEALYFAKDSRNTIVKYEG